MIPVIFSFLFVDFFDTAGTLMAVGSRAGLVNEKGHLVDGDKALLADSTATVIGSVLGTSSTTSFVESLTGVEAGGRTGLTAISTEKQEYLMRRAEKYSETEAFGEWQRNILRQKPSVNGRDG